MLLFLIWRRYGLGLGCLSLYFFLLTEAYSSYSCLTYNFDRVSTSYFGNLCLPRLLTSIYLGTNTMNNCFPIPKESITIKTRWLATDSRIKKMYYKTFYYKLDITFDFFEFCLYRTRFCLLIQSRSPPLILCKRK